MPPTTPTANFKHGWVDDGSLAAVYPKTDSAVRDPDDVDSTWAYDTGGLRHTVLNVGLHELVSVSSTGTTTYIANSIQNRIAAVTRWNSANPTKKITVHLRVHVGERAPPNWASLCGTVRIIDIKFNKDEYVPRW